MRYFRSLSLLHKCLVFSIAVHLVLLTFRFAAPQTFDRVFSFKELDVVLVNAASETVPELAKALAQENLDGGGELDRDMASSPFAAGAQISLGNQNEPTTADVGESLARLEQKMAQDRQKLLLLQRKSKEVLQQLQQQNTPQAEIKKQQVLTALGKIEDALRLDSSRPRQKYIGPSTKEAVYAQYYALLRLQIEEFGTRNFPQYGGSKLYGKLIMSIIVNSSGEAVDTHILRSSGYRNLDSRAQAIVRLAAPYPAFTGKLKSQYDQLVIVVGMNFTKDAGWSVQLLEPSAN